MLIRLLASVKLVIIHDSVNFFLSIKAPAVADQNGVIEGYNIWYRTSRDETPPTPPLTSNLSNGTERVLYNETYELIMYYVTPEENRSSVLQYNITGLEGGTSYDIVLQAFTLIGPGPGSDIITAEAKKRQSVNKMGGVKFIR